MNLLDTDLGEGRLWARVGDYYAVTRKPRGLNRSSFEKIPFASMDAIPRGGSYAPAFTLKSPDRIASGTYFERGDILVARITPSFENGKQALAFNLPAPFGYATTEVIPLHPLNAEHNSRLLFFYLLHPDIRHYIAGRMEGSTGRKRVPENVLLALPFPVLEPSEQTAIADTLEAVQRASATEVKCERIAQDLKRAAMHSLFTRGLRGEAQKETESGPVPESWHVAPLARVVLLKRGFDLPISQRQSGDIPVLGSNGVAGYHNESPADIPVPGVLVGRSGSVGRVSFATGKYWPLNTALFAADFFGNDAKFVSYFLDNFDFSRFAQGVSVPTLNRNSFADVPVAIPPVNEQRQIASILDAIDRKIDLHRRKRAALDDLFKALLHKLMTGEIRVGELDLPSPGPSESPTFTLQNGRLPFHKTSEGDQP